MAENIFHQLTQYGIIIHNYIEYYKDDAGKFQIKTFYDGEIYQNLYDKSTVKVTNTFSAIVRAGNITVFYTPDGGEKTEIYKADAESFIEN